MLFFFWFYRDINHFFFWNFYWFWGASFRWSRWVIKIYQLNDFLPFIILLRLLMISTLLISLILICCQYLYIPFLISFFSSFIISFLSRFPISIFLIGWHCVTIAGRQDIFADNFSFSLLLLLLYLCHYWFLIVL